MKKRQLQTFIVGITNIMANAKQSHLCILLFAWLTFLSEYCRRGAVDEGAIYKAFGKAVAERRSAIGKTQERVASELDLSRASLANIERGKQRVFLHQVLALADALELGSAHEIVPARAVSSRPGAKADVTMSGAKGLSKDQKALVNNIVNALTATSQRDKK